MKVSVVGLGYVGSVAAAGLASAGHDVLGVDIDPRKIDTYRRGHVPFYEPGLSDLIGAGLRHENLRFLHTTEILEPLGDAIIIATGTPSRDTGGADLSYVRGALSWIKERQPDGGLVIVKSTVPPGTGVSLAGSILADAPFEYTSNPEFLREGQAITDWFEPDRIVVGTNDQRIVPLVKELYRGIEAPFLVTDVTSAEMIKYAANGFLATKVSFINEIAALCDRLGATIDDVARGLALDPRIGSSFLRAGVGYGGSCFPKDTRALGDLAIQNGHDFDLLRSVINVNNRQRLLPMRALREQFGQLYGIRVGILGLAFKPNTDDVRESPSIPLIRALIQEGAMVKAYDPRASAAARDLLPESVKLEDTPTMCAEGTEALVLMTEWEEIVEADWEAIASACKQPSFLFDGRNALDPERMQELGFHYRGVGRGALDPRKTPITEGSDLGGE